MKGDRRTKTTRDQELRRLAAKIRDMDHLDSLVSQVPEKMQAAVRGLMLEHVKFKPLAGATKVSVSEQAEIVDSSRRPAVIARYPDLVATQ